MSALIIGIEGIDGAGKSTVATWLLARGRSVGIRTSVLRAGGDGAGDTRDHDLAETRLDKRAREALFVERAGGSALMRAYDSVRRAASTNDLLILDRTYVSHVAGKRSTFAVNWKPELLRATYDRLLRDGVVEPASTMIFVFRSPSAILGTLRRRRIETTSLEAYDAYLLDHPSALRREQDLLRRTCDLMDGHAIDNRTLTGLHDQLELLWQSLTDKVRPRTQRIPRRSDSVRAHPFSRHVASVKASLAEFDDESAALVTFLRETWTRDGTVFVAGDGGSAALAAHIACDYLKLRTQRGGPDVRSLVEAMPTLTMLANDFSFADVFALQLRSVARPCDAILLISGSGRSANLLRAAETARSLRLPVFAMVGFGGSGPLKGLASASLVVDSTDHRVIEDVHHVIAHATVATFVAAARSRRVLVLDRDGVLGESPSAGQYVPDASSFRWIPGSLEALCELKKAGWSMAVATNQRGIALGQVSAHAVDSIHARINADLAPLGAAIDAFFVCPHDVGDACACRKPRTGLVEMAARTFGADVADCVVIGDSGNDIAMGRRLGCLTVGLGGAIGDVTARNLAAVVPLLLQQHAP